MAKQKGRRQKQGHWRLPTKKIAILEVKEIREEGAGGRRGQNGYQKTCPMVPTENVWKPKCVFHMALRNNWIAQLLNVERYLLKRVRTAQKQSEWRSDVALAGSVHWKLGGFVDANRNENWQDRQVDQHPKGNSIDQTCGRTTGTFVPCKWHMGSGCAIEMPDAAVVEEAIGGLHWNGTRGNSRMYSTKLVLDTRNL